MKPWFVFALVWLTGTGAWAETSRLSPLQFAQQLGGERLPYVWGATDPAMGGLDCSGFVRYVFQKTYGVVLPDEAGLQYEYLRQNGRVWDGTTGKWNRPELQPGDLIFLCGTCPTQRPSPITHVMMYVGGNRMVGSQNMGRRLEIGGQGVGFYRFTPRPPCGNPKLDLPIYRSRPLLYAYGRVLPKPGQTSSPLLPVAASQP
jgi:cell wall-associated NlpC family hydrolase